MSNSTPSSNMDCRGPAASVQTNSGVSEADHQGGSQSEDSTDAPGTSVHGEEGTYGYPHGPVVNGAPSVYSMVYSVVDGSGYPINVAPPGAPQSIVPAATYYIPAPVYGYPSENSPNTNGYYMGGGSATDGGQQVIYTQCYPNSAAGPPGTTIYYPGGPTAPHCYPPGYNYVPNAPAPWSGACPCVSCRSATPVTPQQPSHGPPAPVPTMAAAASPRTPAYGPPDSEILSVHRQSVSSATSPGNGAQSPGVSNVGPTTTPLSSRQTVADGRRRLSAVSARDVNDSMSPVMSERKKRKMGYLNNILYKTEMCRDYQQSGCCPRGKSCQFAHGGMEVHHPKNHPLYKTAFCFDFKKDGRCPRGDACFHVHHPGEMRDKPNRSRGMRGPRFTRSGRGSITSKNGSPLVFTSRSRSSHGVDGSRNRGSIDGQMSGDSSPRDSAHSLSGDALPNTSDVKNTMLLLQRLSSENTATLLKKMAEDDVLRGNPVAH